MISQYPWLAAVWEKWQVSLESSRFPNAVLLETAAGFGSEALVSALSRAVLCQNNLSEGCGFCHSCQLMESNSHPDFHCVQPEKEGKTITVEQIRQCTRVAYESSQLGGLRLFVIEPAEFMNEPAANALLKTLEEPPERCIFLLVSDRVSALMPTIISRCQKWRAPHPDYQEVMHWLEQRLDQPVDSYIPHLVDGAPLSALAFIEQNKSQQYTSIESELIKLACGDGDIISLSKMISVEPIERLSWIWHILTDAQKIQYGVLKPFYTPGSETLSKAKNYSFLYDRSRELLALLNRLGEHSGLNAELLIMDWLFNFNEETCL